MRISDWSSDVCSSDLLPVQTRRAFQIGNAVVLGQQVNIFLLPQAGDQLVLGRDERGPVGHACFPDQAGKALRGPHTMQRLGRADHRLRRHAADRSEEHTSELQSLMRISYAVFCLKKKNNNKTHTRETYLTYNTNLIMHIT